MNDCATGEAAFRERMPVLVCAKNQLRYYLSVPCPSWTHLWSVMPSVSFDVLLHSVTPLFHTVIPVTHVVFTNLKSHDSVSRNGCLRVTLMLEVVQLRTRRSGSYNGSL
jgi:hypothetical protein